MKIPIVHRDLFGGPHLSPITSFLCVFGETWLQVCNHFSRANGVSFVCSGAGRGAGPLAKQLPAHEAVIEVLCPPSGPSLPLEPLRMTSSSSECPTGTQRNRRAWRVWGSDWRRVCVMAQQTTKDEQSLRSLGSEDPVRWPHWMALQTCSEWRLSIQIRCL